MANLITFEDHLKNIEGNIEILSTSKIPLEESMKIYKDSLDSLKVARKILEEAKLLVIEEDEEESAES